MSQAFTSGLQIAKGATFGKYVIDDLLGTGGMAEVYRARHVALGRPVALKIMHSALAMNQAHVDRFMQEARAASSVTHPNITAILDVGEVDDRPYLVMEYLEGETLSSLFARRGRMSPMAITDVLLPLISAIGTAHAAGIVHRDVKPENIFLAVDPRGGERPVLLDFGISKQVQGKSLALTEVGQFLGTPYYMSPEQIQMNVPLDGRADQYALGVVLYQLSTGVLPFRSDQSLYLLFAEIVLGETELPTVVEPSIPRDFEVLTVRAMAAKRDQRFPNIARLGQALLSFASPPVRAAWSAEFAVDPSNENEMPAPLLKAQPSWRVTLAPKVAATSPRSAIVLCAADLRVVKSFEECTDEQLDAFLLSVDAYQYPAGARLFEQGEEATGCFVVLSGQFEIMKDSPVGAKVLLNLAGAGELIGQTALVEGGTRSATVVARTPLTVLSIGRDLFQRLLAAGSPVAMRLQLLLAISAIRQLRTATGRLSTLLEARATANADRTRDLEVLHAAVQEWSVDIP